MTADNRHLVVDASVAIKWHLVETSSGEAVRFLEPTLILHAPEFFAAECSNVLYKVSSQRGEIDAERARSILRDLLAHSLQFHATAALASLAFDLAVEIAKPSWRSTTTSTSPLRSNSIAATSRRIGPSTTRSARPRIGAGSSGSPILCRWQIEIKETSP